MTRAIDVTQHLFLAGDLTATTSLMPDDDPNRDMNADESRTAAETVAAYYDALRAGEPLGPFFADEPGVRKVGLSERLDGHDAIVTGLQEQTETTADWTVESRDRTVTERTAHAWYHDDVHLAWTDTESGARHDFETRWSGTLETSEEGWQFVVLHVSTPVEGDL